jgi:hypothetical protein
MMKTHSILTQLIAQKDFTPFSHFRSYMGQLSVAHYAMKAMCLQWES